VGSRNSVFKALDVIRQNPSIVERVEVISTSAVSTEESAADPSGYAAARLAPTKDCVSLSIVEGEVGNSLAGK